MDNNQVLIISFWNDTVQFPLHGIFIQEQAAAICSLRENVVFLQVNVLPSRQFYLKKTIEYADFYKSRLIILNLYSRLWKFWYVNPWALERAIYNIIKKKGNDINPGIIHSNVIFPCGIVGYLLAKRMGARLLISEHWSKAEKLLRNLLYKRIAMKAYKKSFAIICVSEFLKNKLSLATGHPNLVTIPNIVNTKIFSYRPKPDARIGPLCLMCAASWRLPKRLDLIFEAVCAYAAESQINIELTVVGKGMQADLLRSHKIPFNLQVRWTGYIDRSEIAELFQKTHIFLHASNIETFSIVTAEALSTGTPVLASNTGALPELINEQNGLLAENTHEGWLNGIREIVTIQYDYQAIAFQNQNKYSPEIVGKSIIELYNMMDAR